MTQVTVVEKLRRADTGPARPRAGRVILLGALAAMGAVSLDTYLPGLPQLAIDLGATTSQTQLTLTACMAGLAMGQLVAGPISDRVGRRRPLLLLGLLTFAALSGFCAVSGSIEASAVLITGLTTAAITAALGLLLLTRSAAS